MTNLIKLLINISVLRAWCREGGIMVCHVTFAQQVTLVFQKELKRKTKTEVKSLQLETYIHLLCQISYFIQVSHFKCVCVCYKGLYLCVCDVG